MTSRRSEKPTEHQFACGIHRIPICKCYARHVMRSQRLKAENLTLKELNGKLVEALDKLISFEHDGCETKDCSITFCCASYMVNQEKAKEALALSRRGNQ